MNTPKGKLIIIGGTVDQGNFPGPVIDLPQQINFFEQGILKRIIAESSKKELSAIEIVTTASSMPKASGAGYIKAFNQLGASNVNVLSVRTRAEANASQNIERLMMADVVFFTGGDQLRLSSIIGGTSFHHLLQEKYKNENFIIAGTSAGAAAASVNMIYEGSSHKALSKGEVKVTGGLGFINNVIIDTHFVERGRMGRLLYACASNPVNLGIGLGEDSGLLITGGKNMEAIGSGLIILVDGTHIRHTNMTDVEIGQPVSIQNLIVHVMSSGDHFDLENGELSIGKLKKRKAKQPSVPGIPLPSGKPSIS